MSPNTSSSNFLKFNFNAFSFHSKIWLGVAWNVYDDQHIVPAPQGLHILAKYFQIKISSPCTQCTPIQKSKRNYVKESSVSPIWDTLGKHSSHSGENANLLIQHHDCQSQLVDQVRPLPLRSNETLRLCMAICYRGNYSNTR